MKQKDISDLPNLPYNRLEQLFNIYQTDNSEYYYNIINTVNFDADKIAPYMYFTHTVKQGETYTVISYKHYETINLWWLICSFNNISNPTSLPAPGTVLRILFPKFVSNVLTQLGKS